MDTAFNAVLADYERRAADETRILRERPEEFERRVDDFLISVGPATGRMLHLLAIGAKATTILEVGCSYGYSTLWLADAARANGGKVQSLEIAPKKVEYARAQLAKAGLDGFVEFHVGDAVATLARLRGPFEFVLLDLWKDLYPACFEAFHPKLAPGALVAADNMTYPATALPAARVYQALVRTKSDMESLLLPIGSGVELSRKNGSATMA